MWECKNCGETVEDEFETCWNCQTNPTSPDAENEDVAHASGQLGNNEHQERGGSAAGSLERRYRDAYRVARATILGGKIIKILAVAMAVAALWAAFVGREEVDLFAGIGFAVAAIVYAVGIGVSAQGQLLLTSIDQV